MKYSSYIDNITAMEWGMDIKTAYLFDWIYTLPAWAEHITISDGNFYFASKKKATEELPLLTDKVDTMYRYYKGLEEMGLIKLIKVGNKDYIQLTEKAKKWGKSSEHSDKNPSNVGKVSEKRPDRNPTDKNTILDKNTSISSVASDKTKTLDDFKKELYDSLTPLVGTGEGKFDKDLVRQFYEYWTELSRSGKKLRFMDEKFFDVDKRLAFWKRRDDEKKSLYPNKNNSHESPTSIRKPENLRN